jgi:hypothetical protein
MHVSSGGEPFATCAKFGLPSPSSCNCRGTYPGRWQPWKEVEIMRLVGSEGLHVFHERTSDVTKDAIQIQAWGVGKGEWRSCGVCQRSCMEHGTKIFQESSLPNIIIVRYNSERATGLINTICISKFRYIAGKMDEIRTTLTRLPSCFSSGSCYN